MNELICGLDEAGRGPLAGPVTAGACMLPEGFDTSFLGDSKKLSERQRERAFEEIQRHAFWGIGWCSAGEIDEINILQASLLAMRRAFDDMCQRFPEDKPSQAIADGLYVPILSVPCRALVKADALEPCVSAASILAKVSRDRFMIDLHAREPRYDFHIHKGYPTERHRQALVQWGLSEWHRKTFRWKAP